MITPDVYSIEPYISFWSVFISFFILALTVVFLGYIMRNIKPDLFFKNPSKIYERLPIERIDSNGLGMTKDGKFFRVVEVIGRNYDSIEECKAEAMYLQRKQWLEGVPTDITVLTQSHRVSYQMSVQKEKIINNKYAQKVFDRWGSLFKSNFRTRHYLIFITESSGMADKAAEKMTAIQGRSKAAKQMRATLEEALIQLEDRLGKSYEIKRLNHFRTLCYFASLLRGKPSAVRPNRYGFVDGLLTDVDLYWPNGERYQEYRGAATRYSAWLRVEDPADWSVPDTINDLYKLEQEFSVYQTISRIDKVQAQTMISDKQRNLTYRMSRDSGDREIAEIKDRVDSNDIALFKHRLAIEVYGNSLKELNERVRDVKRIFEEDMYLVRREDFNQEAAFWAKFPGAQTINKCIQYPTSENLSHYNSFPARIKGLDSCSFGNAPWATFKTIDGDLHSFVPNLSEDPKSLGHILILGSSGSGKSVLIAFLILCCKKFHNFRAICLDRMQGLEAYTRMFKGHYFTGEKVKDIGLNPLQLSDTSNNRAFLANWLMLLAQSDSKEDRALLNDRIGQTFEIDPQFRNLEHFADNITRPGEPLHDALSAWVGSGEFSGYFSAENDTLSFKDSWLSTFDMTTLFDLDAVLGPFLYYIFHKTVSEAGQDPFIFFVDEAPRAFRNPTFGPYAKTILDEFRKLRGSGIFAGQNASDFMKLDPKIVESFRKNVATYFIFPDAGAEREHYVDGLGLNDREFQWVRTCQERHQVLVKKKTGESVILNVDLSGLNELLHCFDSGKDDGDRIRAMAEENPEGFRDDYIADAIRRRNERKAA